MASKDPLGWEELFDDRILSLDSAHVFLVTAQSLAAQSELIAEVGCGRGALVKLDRPGGAWQDLRGPGRTVVGIDVEDAGTENPVIDEFRLIPEDGRWPLSDGSVDLAVSDFVLEHVTDPPAFVAELTRILRPGGVFLARTVSRHSLLAAGARLVPNEAHAKVLNRFQPGRQEQDVFRTAYQMNTRKDLAALFDQDFEWAAASRTGLDRYFMPWPRLARTAVAIERRFPRNMQTALVVCARRR
ncbi:MAG TPA: class I SAM-dependent methyltransferase [Acidimicrobiales bacterium]|jgi:SAM-dependent methyltransferase|nr:class I SAM-dependent methyltransferase [Acidimicrobiales bacterium]